MGMQDTMSLERLSALHGTPVYAQDGDKIGSVEEIFYDQDTREPEWIGVGTGFFGTKRVLVPVQGASITDDGVTVPYAKDQVKDTPDVAGDEISESTETELYSYYGLQPSTRRSDSVLPEGSAGYAGTAGYGDTDRQTGLENVGERSMTRSEEELRVGKTEREAGTARLRKWVETEPVEADVTLRRETVHVNRETIDEPVGDAQIGEDEIDVTLRAEEAVVQKDVRARERISLDKDVETETETVEGEVRKERVEVEGDVLDRDRADRI